MYSKAIVIFFMFSIMLGCGFKAVPKPPEEFAPNAIEDLRAIYKDKKVMLRWHIPTKRRDSSKLVDLAGFKILRRIIINPSNEEVSGKQNSVSTKEKDAINSINSERLPTETIDIIEISELDPTTSESEVMKFLDEGKDLSPYGFEYGKKYIYTVVSFNKSGIYSFPSNEAIVYPLPPPKSPDSLKAFTNEKGIQLRWQPDKESLISGIPIKYNIKYNIYRRNPAGQYSDVPINNDIIQGDSYIDLNVEKGHTYYYIIRAVARYQENQELVENDDIWVESPDSNEVKVTFIDNIPPKSPKGLIAIRLENSISLSWDINDENDLEGYHVYRGESLDLDKGYKRLTETPIKHITFTDKDIEPDMIYYYAITAIDNASPQNESKLSDAVKVEPNF